LVSCTMKNLATPGKRRKLQVKPEEKLDFRRGDLEQGGQIGRIFAQRGIVWAVFFWCDVWIPNDWMPNDPMPNVGMPNSAQTTECRTTQWRMPNWLG
jgi:hypothetical protein